MPNVDQAALKKKRQLINGLDEEFNYWRPHYRDLARFILPRRYEWLNSVPQTLMSSTESPSSPGVSSNRTSQVQAMNAQILDSTGTESARTLSHGLMNGLSSPQTKWFNLRLAGFPDELEGYPHEYLTWLEDSRDRMLTVFAESNFYGALAQMYVDLVIFGIGSTIIYDDFEEIIRCYHSPVGQFRFITDDRQFVQGMCRIFTMQVQQVVDRWGTEYLSPQTKAAFERGGESLLKPVTIYHLIEPNKQNEPLSISSQFKYREMYWEASLETGTILSLDGFRDRPFMAPRWDVSGNDTYAHSPGMDALPDIRQLQHETQRKAQALDKLVRPPLAADIAMKTSPQSLLPGGVAWLPSSSSVGAKPLYTVQPPLGEMTADIAAIQQRIRRIFYNHLFRNVSDLDTVRSATEVQIRKSEDMVILGAVLERMQNEGFDPGIRRTFNIMQDKGMFLEPPAGLENEKVEIQYVSMLAEAQRSMGTSSVERGFQMVGELAALYPEIMDVPNWEESVRGYWEMLGISPKNINSRETVAQLRAAREAQLEMQQAALVGKDLTSAAKNLSETEVGVGNTALDSLL